YRLTMAADGPIHRAVSRDELVAIAAADRAFVDLLFAIDPVLEGVDLTESRFERCLFQGPLLQSIDFSESEFTECKFEPLRLAACKFAKAKFRGCSWFDADKKK